MEARMKLSRPKIVTFWIAVALLALGLLAHLGIIPFGGYAFWLAFLGGALLVLALLVRGL
jgi:hypothetical protein